jgi:hypothetical protein
MVMSWSGTRASSSGLRQVAPTDSCNTSTCAQVMRQGRAWRDALELEWPDPSRAHRCQLVGQGVAGRHPIAIVIGVIGPGATSSGTRSGFDTVDGSKGEVGAALAEQRPPQPRLTLRVAPWLATRA